ncbi:WecB/TagA/CpsF family glycosyltransferase [Nonomuraea sp. NPDC049152]|uniref:WecB/TagA/CpsF family glycosyltransferase n=1 Tax=Nonomuraea sp. NPDC049152 TaxID=3154350 RepID=UPI0033D579DD
MSGTPPHNPPTPGSAPSAFGEDSGGPGRAVGGGARESKSSHEAATAVDPVEGRPPRVRVAGIEVDPFTERQVVEWVAAALDQGKGGHIVTPNVDICHAVSTDPALSALVAAADLVVADGMPLVWASKLLGTTIPERVTGADLIWSLSAMAAGIGRSVYLLGGPPGVAARAARELAGLYHGLEVCGVDAPPFGFEENAEELDRVRARLVAARPSVVFVGLGFPRQDRLIAELRADVPSAWFVGCGSAIAFAAGSVPRAPAWMRRAGAEWLFRLASEPGRLARRYLVDDVPFAVRLMARSLLVRR